MDFLRRQWFTAGLVAIGVSLLAVGGWEIFASLNAAHEEADNLRKRNEQLKVRTAAPIPSDGEMEYWKNRFAEFAGNFERIRERIAREEEYEDLYFTIGLKPDFRSPPGEWRRPAWVPANVAVDRATAHWAFRGGKHDAPVQAFDTTGFRQAYGDALRALVREGALFALAEPNVKLLREVDLADLKDPVAAILEIQKGYWAAVELVRALRAFEQSGQKFRVDAIDFVTPRASAGTRPGGPPSPVPLGTPPPPDAVRETRFYRAVPVDLAVSVDFAAAPKLAAALLSPPPGREIAPFRWRNRFVIEPYKGARPPSGRPPQAQESETTVRMEIALEWWDWEVPPLELPARK